MVTLQQIMNSFPRAGEIHRNESVRATAEVYQLTGCLPALFYNEDDNNGICYVLPLKSLLESSKVTPESLFALRDTGWWIRGEMLVFRIG